MNEWLLAGLLLFQGMGGGPRAAKTAGGPKVASPAFTLRELPLGLTARHRYGDGSSKYILSMTGNGVAIIDFDHDGKPDLLFADGVAPVLYRNTGKAWVDVSAGSGLQARPWGQGVCAGDFDNDGWTDVLLTYYGASRLYRNEQGKFRDVTAAAGLPESGKRFATGCAFVDYDRDGRLDLVVSNYVSFDLATASAPGATKYCTWLGLDVFCGPRGFPTDGPILYRNEGAGKFRDVSRTALQGISGLHYGLGVVTADFDGDGWMDVYIACDSTPGILLRNNRDGTLTDVAVEAGAAYGADGEELGSMGVAAVDVDGDGRLDLVKTNFIDESPSLYRNLGDWFFVDATQETGFARDATAVGWGVGVMDFDLDGRPDMVMANGHIYPELKAAYRQSKSLYWNGGGVFATLRTGTPMASRGLAVGDLDGDGVAEVVVANMNAAPSVYRVEGRRGSSFGVQLEGTRSNRSAIGARVKVTVEGHTQTDEVRSGGSYGSQHDFTLLFGLGPAKEAGRVEVRWPNGETEVIGKLEAGALYRIKEGAGVVGRVPWR
ncbi:MAG: CRTAC1 family protein [Bryobacteraceae bacterium]|nr:CRTAC1 family protein [Bryobacteraceae bacterium]